MQDYKRLTEKGVPCSVASHKFGGRHEQYYYRLAELEDKIENRTLIELQDKEENLIGQQVYAIDICSYPKGKIVTNFEEDEDEIIIGFTSNEIVTVNTTRGCNMYHKNGLWFLTKAKAEQKLKELQEQNNEETTKNN